MLKITENRIIVSEVVLAVLVRRGTRVHKNRVAHGIAYNENGDTTYRFETGEELICHAGECIYLPKGASYVVANGNVPQKCVHAINFQLVSDGEEYRPAVFRVRGKEAVISAYSRAEKAWLKKQGGYHEECLSALYAILAQIKGEAGVYVPQERLMKRLAPALSYIEGHFFEEDMHAPMLARLCGMSEAYFRRLFRKAFSTSPVSYIRDRRIAYAKELLRVGEHSVGEVAVLSGFGDAAYFSREFKKAVGVAPRDFFG